MRHDQEDIQLSNHHEDRQVVICQERADSQSSIAEPQKDVQDGEVTEDALRQRTP